MVQKKVTGLKYHACVACLWCAKRVLNLDQKSNWLTLLNTMLAGLMSGAHAVLIEARERGGEYGKHQATHRRTPENIFQTVFIIVHFAFHLLQEVPEKR